MPVNKPPLWPSELPPKICPDRHNGHNWVTMGHRKRDLHGFENSYEPGTLWRYCNFCKQEDRVTPLCEQEVRESGPWPRWHTCGHVAPVTSPHPPGLGLIRHSNDTPGVGREPDGQDHHYCRTHDPERMLAKERARNAMATLKYDRESWQRAHGYHGKKMMKLLNELTDWANMNIEFVESDEWLSVVIRDARLHLSEMRTTRGAF